MGIVDTGNTNWKHLYRVGGLVPFVVLVLYSSQFLTFLFGETYPTTAEDWFMLFQRSKFLGFFMLNALDIFSIAIMGLMYLELYFALRESDQSRIAFAAFFAFLGIAVFVSTRAIAVSAIFSLSEQYAVANPEVPREHLLSAGQAILSISRATPETIGFLFLAISGLIISVVILKSEIFSNVIGYIGVLAFTFTLANDLSLLIAPALADIFMPINGFLWLAWWILIGFKLLKLAGNVSHSNA
jgi:hypothetical protein